MIDTTRFLSQLQAHQLSFFAGVPDSLLKQFCSAVEENKLGITCANEGSAVALAAGYYLATGKIGVCYLQNSGLGNAINPLMSLTHPDVYAIPALLVIGWRGEPGKPDEPQHVAQGKATLATLDVLGIEYAILPDNDDDAHKAIATASKRMTETSAPYALVVKKGTFAPFNGTTKANPDLELSREQALQQVLSQLPPDAAIVSTTGKISRELFELRKARNEDHSHDFLTVGSMGHASSIALGIALAKPHRSTFCFDGDGALIMQMGTLAIIADQKPANFKHIVFNNGAHDSVGGQNTVGFQIDLPAIALACGYKSAACVKTSAELSPALIELLGNEGPALLEIRVRKGARSDLGRPDRSPQINKKDFMNGLI